MDRFFDRLGEFLRGLLDREADSGGAGYSAQDPFMHEAYAELDEYLRTGRSRPRPPLNGRRPRPRQAAPPPPAELRRDYANLEVSFGAPFGEVRQAHRRLLRQYHPDRFDQDPRKQELATEITQKINESYQRIRVYARRAGLGD
jgi:DnaJ-domain-containing protein 1